MREQLIFPEIDFNKVDKMRGMNISIVTTARNDEQARALLKGLGMPFRAITTDVRCQMSRCQHQARTTSDIHHLTIDVSDESMAKKSLIAKANRESRSLLYALTRAVSAVAGPRLSAQV